MAMRTNIVLDDDLVARAIKISGKRTKRELIMTALKEFVQNHSRLDIRKLKGKISFKPGYDYKSLREGKG
jgi:Arc/MetJ family transcription regulator